MAEAWCFQTVLQRLESATNANPEVARHILVHLKHVTGSLRSGQLQGPDANGDSAQRTSTRESPSNPAVLLSMLLTRLDLICEAHEAHSTIVSLATQIRVDLVIAFGDVSAILSTAGQLRHSKQQMPLSAPLAEFAIRTSVHARYAGTPQACVPSTAPLVAPGHPSPKPGTARGLLPCDLVETMQPHTAFRATNVRVRDAARVVEQKIDLDTACIFAGSGGLFFLTAETFVKLLPGPEPAQVDVAFVCPSPLKGLTPASATIADGTMYVLVRESPLLHVLQQEGSGELARFKLRGARVTRKMIREKHCHVFTHAFVPHLCWRSCALPIRWECAALFKDPHGPNDEMHTARSSATRRVIMQDTVLVDPLDHLAASASDSSISSSLGSGGFLCRTAKLCAHLGDTFDAYIALDWLFAAKFGPVILVSCAEPSTALDASCREGGRSWYKNGGDDWFKLKGSFVFMSEDAESNLFMAQRSDLTLVSLTVGDSGDDDGLQRVTLSEMVTFDECIQSMVRWRENEFLFLLASGAVLLFNTKENTQQRLEAIPTKPGERIVSICASPSEDGGSRALLLRTSTGRLIVDPNPLFALVLVTSKRHRRRRQQQQQQQKQKQKQMKSSLTSKHGADTSRGLGEDKKWGDASLTCPSSSRSSTPAAGNSVVQRRLASVRSHAKRRALFVLLELSKQEDEMAGPELVALYEQAKGTARVIKEKEQEKKRREQEVEEEESAKAKATEEATADMGKEGDGEGEENRPVKTDQQQERRNLSHDDNGDATRSSASADTSRGTQAEGESKRSKKRLRFVLDHLSGTSAAAAKKDAQEGKESKQDGSKSHKDRAEASGSGKSKAKEAVAPSSSSQRSRVGGKSKPRTEAGGGVVEGEGEGEDEGEGEGEEEEDLLEPKDRLSQLARHVASFQPAWTLQGRGSEDDEDEDENGDAAGQNEGQAGGDEAEAKHKHSDTCEAAQSTDKYADQTAEVSKLTASGGNEASAFTDTSSGDGNSGKCVDVVLPPRVTGVLDVAVSTSHIAIVGTNNTAYVASTGGGLLSKLPWKTIRPEDEEEPSSGIAHPAMQAIRCFLHKGNVLVLTKDRRLLSRKDDMVATPKLTQIACHVLRVSRAGEDNILVCHSAERAVPSFLSFATATCSHLLLAWPERAVTGTSGSSTAMEVLSLEAAADPLQPRTSIPVQCSARHVAATDKHVWQVQSPTDIKLLATLPDSDLLTREKSKVSLVQGLELKSTSHTPQLAPTLRRLGTAPTNGFWRALEQDARCRLSPRQADTLRMYPDVNTPVPASTVSAVLYTLLCQHLFSRQADAKALDREPMELQWLRGHDSPQAKKGEAFDKSCRVCVGRLPQDVPLELSSRTATATTSAATVAIDGGEDVGGSDGEGDESDAAAPGAAEATATAVTAATTHGLGRRSSNASAASIHSARMVHAVNSRTALQHARRTFTTRLHVCTPVAVQLRVTDIALWATAPEASKLWNLPVFLGVRSVASVDGNASDLAWRASYPPQYHRVARSAQHVKKGCPHRLLLESVSLDLGVFPRGFSGTVDVTFRSSTPGIAIAPAIVSTCHSEPRILSPLGGSVRLSCSEEPATAAAAKAIRADTSDNDDDRAKSIEENGDSGSTAPGHHAAIHDEDGDGDGGGDGDQATQPPVSGVVCVQALPCEHGHLLQGPRGRQSHTRATPAFHRAVLLQWAELLRQVPGMVKLKQDETGGEAGKEDARKERDRTSADAGGKDAGGGAAGREDGGDGGSRAMRGARTVAEEPAAPQGLAKQQQGDDFWRQLVAYKCVGALLGELFFVRPMPLLAWHTEDVRAVLDAGNCVKSALVSIDTKVRGHPLSQFCFQVTQWLVPRLLHPSTAYSAFALARLLRNPAEPTVDMWLRLVLGNAVHAQQRGALLGAIVSSVTHRNSSSSNSNGNKSNTNNSSSAVLPLAASGDNCKGAGGYESEASELGNGDKKRALPATSSSSNKRQGLRVREHLGFNLLQLVQHNAPHKLAFACSQDADTLFATMQLTDEAGARPLSLTVRYLAPALLALADERVDVQALLNITHTSPSQLRPVVVSRPRDVPTWVRGVGLSRAGELSEFEVSLTSAFRSAVSACRTAAVKVVEQVGKDEAQGTRLVPLLDTLPMLVTVTTQAGVQFPRSAGAVCVLQTRGVMGRLSDDLIHSPDGLLAMFTDTTAEDAARDVTSLLEPWTVGDVIARTMELATHPSLCPHERAYLFSEVSMLLASGTGAWPETVRLQAAKAVLSSWGRGLGGNPHDAMPLVQRALHILLHASGARDDALVSSLTPRRGDGAVAAFMATSTCEEADSHPHVLVVRNSNEHRLEPATPGSRQLQLLRTKGEEGTFSAAAASSSASERLPSSHKTAAKGPEKGKEKGKGGALSSVANGAHEVDKRGSASKGGAKGSSLGGNDSYSAGDAGTDTRGAGDAAAEEGGGDSVDPQVAMALDISHWPGHTVPFSHKSEPDMSLERVLSSVQICVADAARIAHVQGELKRAYAVKEAKNSEALTQCILNATANVSALSPQETSLVSAAVAGESSGVAVPAAQWQHASAVDQPQPFTSLLHLACAEAYAVADPGTVRWPALPTASAGLDQSAHDPPLLPLGCSLTTAAAIAAGGGVGAPVWTDGSITGSLQSGDSNNSSSSSSSSSSGSGGSSGVGDSEGTEEAVPCVFAGSVVDPVPLMAAAAEQELEEGEEGGMGQALVREQEEGAERVVKKGKKGKAKQGQKAAKEQERKDKDKGAKKKGAKVEGNDEGATGKRGEQKRHRKSLDWMTLWSLRPALQREQPSWLASQSARLRFLLDFVCGAAGTKGHACALAAGLLGQLSVSHMLVSELSGLTIVSTRTTVTETDADAETEVSRGGQGCGGSDFSTTASRSAVADARSILPPTLSRFVKVADTAESRVFQAMHNLGEAQAQHTSASVASNFSSTIDGAAESATAVANCDAAEATGDDAAFTTGARGRAGERSAGVQTGGAQDGRGKYAPERVDMMLTAQVRGTRCAHALGFFVELFAQAPTGTSAESGRAQRDGGGAGEVGVDDDDVGKGDGSDAAAFSATDTDASSGRVVLKAPSSAVSITKEMPVTVCMYSMAHGEEDDATATATAAASSVAGSRSHSARVSTRTSTARTSRKASVTQTGLPPVSDALGTNGSTADDATGPVQGESEETPAGDEGGDAFAGLTMDMDVDDGGDDGVWHAVWPPTEPNAELSALERRALHYMASPRVRVVNVAEMHRRRYRVKLENVPVGKHVLAVTTSAREQPMWLHLNVEDAKRSRRRASSAATASTSAVTPSPTPLASASGAPRTRQSRAPADTIGQPKQSALAAALTAVEATATATSSSSSGGGTGVKTTRIRMGEDVVMFGTPLRVELPRREIRVYAAESRSAIELGRLSKQAIEDEYRQAEALRVRKREAKKEPEERRPDNGGRHAGRRRDQERAFRRGHALREQERLLEERAREEQARDAQGDAEGLEGQGEMRRRNRFFRMLGRRRRFARGHRHRLGLAPEEEQEEDRRRERDWPKLSSMMQEELSPDLLEAGIEDVDAGSDDDEDDGNGADGGAERGAERGAGSGRRASAGGRGAGKQGKNGVVEDIGFDVNTRRRPGPHFILTGEVVVKPEDEDGDVLLDDDGDNEDKVEDKEGEEAKGEEEEKKKKKKKKKNNNNNKGGGEDKSSRGAQIPVALNRCWAALHPVTVRSIAAEHFRHLPGWVNLADLAVKAPEKKKDGKKEEEEDAEKEEDKDKDGEMGQDEKREGAHKVEAERVSEKAEGEKGKDEGDSDKKEEDAAKGGDDDISEQGASKSAKGREGWAEECVDCVAHPAEPGHDVLLVWQNRNYRGRHAVVVYDPGEQESDDEGEGGAKRKEEEKGEAKVVEGEGQKKYAKEAGEAEDASVEVEQEEEKKEQDKKEQGRAGGDEEEGGERESNGVESATADKEACPQEKWEEGDPTEGGADKPGVGHGDEDKPAVEAVTPEELRSIIMQAVEDESKKTAETSTGQSLSSLLCQRALLAASLWHSRAFQETQMEDFTSDAFIQLAKEHDPKSLVERFSQETPQFVPVHAELGRLGSLCPRQIVTHVVQGMYGASSYAFEWLKPWPAWATLLVVFAPSPFALRSVLGGDVGVEHLRVLALSSADAKKKWTAEAVAEAAVPLCEYFDDAERHSIAARARTMHPRCVVGTPTAPLARHAAALSRLAACMDVGQLGTCLKVNGALYELTTGSGGVSSASSTAALHPQVISWCAFVLSLLPLPTTNIALEEAPVAQQLVCNGFTHQHRLFKGLCQMQYRMHLHWRFLQVLRNARSFIEAPDTSLQAATLLLCRILTADGAASSSITRRTIAAAPGYSQFEHKWLEISCPLFFCQDFVECLQDISKAVLSRVRDEANPSALLSVSGVLRATVLGISKDAVDLPLWLSEALDVRSIAVAVQRRTSVLSRVANAPAVPTAAGKDVLFVHRVHAATRDNYAIKDGFILNPRGRLSVSIEIPATPHLRGLVLPTNVKCTVIATQDERGRVGPSSVRLSDLEREALVSYVKGVKAAAEVENTVRYRILFGDTTMEMLIFDPAVAQVSKFLLIALHWADVKGKVPAHQLVYDAEFSVNLRSEVESLRRMPVEALGQLEARATQLQQEVKDSGALRVLQGTTTLWTSVVQAFRFIDQHTPSRTQEVYSGWQSNVLDPLFRMHPSPDTERCPVVQLAHSVFAATNGILESMPWPGDDILVMKLLLAVEFIGMCHGPSGGATAKEGLRLLEHLITQVYRQQKLRAPSHPTVYDGLPTDGMVDAGMGAGVDDGAGVGAPASDGFGAGSGNAADGDDSGEERALSHSNTREQDKKEEEDVTVSFNEDDTLVRIGMSLNDHACKTVIFLIESEDDAEKEEGDSEKEDKDKDNQDDDSDDDDNSNDNDNGDEGQDEPATWTKLKELIKKRTPPRRQKADKDRSVAYYRAMFLFLFDLEERLRAGTDLKGFVTQQFKKAHERLQQHLTNEQFLESLEAVLAQLSAAAVSLTPDLCRIVERYCNQSLTAPPVCENHGDDTMATVDCEECGVKLCLECDNFWHLPPSKRSHERTSMKPPPSRLNLSFDQDKAVVTIVCDNLKMDVDIERLETRVKWQMYGKLTAPPSH